MRRIHKGAEPRSLREHRRSGGTYESYKERHDVRAALLREQGASASQTSSSGPSAIRRAATSLRANVF